MVAPTSVLYAPAAQAVHAVAAGKPLYDPATHVEQPAPEVPPERVLYVPTPQVEQPEVPVATLLKVPAAHAVQPPRLVVSNP